MSQAQKVYITGRGLITPLGNGLAANEAGLRSGKSGIVHIPDFAAHDLGCQVGGVADEAVESPLLDRKKLRYCPPTAIMSIVAVAEALAEAGINMEDIPGMNIAVLGGVASGNYVEAWKSTQGYVDHGHSLRHVSPYIVPRVMPSSAVSNLSLTFGFTGEVYDLSVACASSAAAILMGMRWIRSGLYDVVVAGGAETLDWVQALGFCAIRALSHKYNDMPERASRPFDRDRDGFVLAGGAGYVILESERSCRARGARPIVEVSGGAGNSNARDMVVPDQAASAGAMRGTLRDAGLAASSVGYINTHGTATPVGDPVELAAIHEVFGNHPVAINSTKSQTGHMVGATGAAEVIFTSMMMEKNFISPTINLDNPEDAFAWADLVRECRTGTRLEHALSNSFAFGGSNVCIALSQPK